MGRMVAGLLKKLPEAWQPYAVLASVFGTGGAVALALVGFVNLPARVDAQQAEISALGDEVVTLFEEADRSRRQDSTQTVELQRIRCLIEAMAVREDPIRKCGL